MMSKIWSKISKFLNKEFDLKAVFDDLSDYRQKNREHNYEIFPMWQGLASSFSVYPRTGWQEPTQMPWSSINNTHFEMQGFTDTSIFQSTPMNNLGPIPELNYGSNHSSSLNYDNRHRGFGNNPHSDWITNPTYSYLPGNIFNSGNWNK